MTDAERISAKGRGPTRGRGRLAAAVGVIVLIAAAPAFAQRGGDFVLDEKLEVQRNPNTGFPGLFDTEMAPEGGWVGNLPATTLYYGVTPRLTLGTVTAELATLVTGPPGFAMLARYQLASTSWFRSTLDGILATAAITTGVSDPELNRLRGGLLASNTELVLGRVHRLTAHAWLAHGSIGPLLSGPSGATAILAGGSYALVLTDWASVQLTGLYIASVTGSLEVDSEAGESDFTGAISPLNRLFARGTVSLRKGRWLFDVGAMKIASRFLPWINVAVQLGSAS